MTTSEWVIEPEDAAGDDLSGVAVFDLDPGVAATWGVAGGGALGDQAFHSHGGGEYLEPLPGLVDVGGDRRQLQRRSPVGGELFQPLPADGPALGAQVDSPDCQQVEGGIGGGEFGGFVAGVGGAGDESLLERIEAEATFRVEDDQLAGQHRAWRQLPVRCVDDVGEPCADVVAVAGPKPRFVSAADDDDAAS
jgi:hypothetical protein